MCYELIMSEKKPGIEIFNKKAKYEYFFVSQHEAGIILTGTEIKSIRLGNANLKEGYCIFRKGELYLRNIHISEYKFGSYHNHEVKRQRKLLLKRGELKKLERKVKEKGMGLIPYRLFINERGLAKIDIALTKGKKAYDKRETIKQKDQKRGSGQNVEEVLRKCLQDGSLEYALIKSKPIRKVFLKRIDQN